MSDAHDARASGKALNNGEYTQLKNLVYQSGLPCWWEAVHGSVPPGMKMVEDTRGRASAELFRQVQDFEWNLAPLMPDPDVSRFEVGICMPGSVNGCVVARAAACAVAGFAVTDHGACVRCVLQLMKDTPDAHVEALQAWYYAQKQALVDRKKVLENHRWPLPVIRGM